MSTTTDHASARPGRSGTPRGADHRPPSGSAARAWLSVGVLALVVGLALGRFMFASSDAEEAAPALDQTISTAIGDLERAVATDADDVSSWQQLGVAYTRGAVQIGDPTFYDLAERAFDRAEELAPGDPLTLIGRGNLKLSLHEFAEAMQLGERALAAQPDSVVALGVIVDAEVELGRYGAAAEHLQRMLDLRPGLPALSRASYLRELNGDLSGAIQALRQAEAAGSDSRFDAATVIALLGDLHFRSGDLATAEAAYERAEQYATGIVPAALGRARVLAARGELDAAIGELREVVDRYPQPEAVILLGELQARAGQDDAAADTFELVRTIGQLQQASGQITDLEMALFEADHGDPATAVPLARAAHAARPTTSSPATRSRGRCSGRAGPTRR